MLNIAVLVSGGGTNLQTIIDAIKDSTIENAKIATVVSSRERVYAIERAKKNKIPYAGITKKDFPSVKEYDKVLIEHMRKKQIDLVVLAGFLPIIGKDFINEYPNKIINIHPSLIPSFSGRGCYGIKVHEKALEYGVKITGATVHFVNEVTDGGAIILQKAVEVKEDDTPETLQRRVMKQGEWKILPQAINLFCQGKLKIDGRKVYIDS